MATHNDLQHWLDFWRQRIIFEYEEDLVIASFKDSKLIGLIIDVTRNDEDARRNSMTTKEVLAEQDLMKMMSNIGKNIMDRGEELLYVYQDSDQ